MAQQLSTNTFGPAKWIVTQSNTPWFGTHTSISAAITSAIANQAQTGLAQTITILPGTYTENITLVSDVNLTAWGCDSSQGGTGSVVLNGTLTMSAAGTSTVFGIQFQTNSAPAIVISGTVQTELNLTNCYINASNGLGIDFSSSNAGSYISLSSCNGDLGASQQFFSNTGAGNIEFINTFITNTGSSTTASTASSGRISIRSSSLLFPIITSGTSVLGSSFSQIFTENLNVTALTIGGSVASLIDNTLIQSGTASCISCSSATQVYNCVISSSNVNSMTGVGSITHFGNTYTGSANVNATTQVAASTKGIIGTTPTTGALGESLTATGSVALTNNTDTIICSLSITPGNWLVTGSTTYASQGAFVGTQYECAIATGTSSFGSLTGVATNVLPVTNVFQPYMPTIPFVLSLTATTTYNFNANMVFSAGTVNCSGTILAVRIG